MKISQQLHQFEGEKALLIVTGEQAADFLIASDGEIKWIEEFKIKNPKYSDREGYFRRSGRGEVIGSGSVYEPKKDVVRDKFLEELSSESQKLQNEHDVSQVYLFGPEHVLNENEKALPERLKKKIALRVKGQFTKDKPTKLLERLQKELEKHKEEGDGLPPAVPGKGQARKILQKFESAKNYIKGKFK